MAGDIFCAQVKEASTSLNKDEEIRMRHHLYSTEQLWDLGWNTHRNTQTRHIKWTICHTHSLVKTRHFSHTNTKILQKHKLILEHAQSYLHSSVESTQSFEKLSCSIGVLLSYPLLFCPFLWLRTFICQACVCIPTYVSPSVVKARAKDTDGTQMETDNRADQRTLHYTHSYLLLFRSCEALSITLTISATDSATAALLNSLSFADWIPVLSHACSLKLCLPPSQSLFSSSSSSPIFPHTVPSSVFMGRVFQQRHNPHSPNPTPLPLWILANHPLLTGPIQPAFSAMDLAINITNCFGT